MSTEPDPRSEEGGSRTERAQESYTWPLVAIVVAILPQVLIPTSDRVGPPSLVPIIETVAFLVMLIIAAKPGPVPRRLRPTILLLFGVLIGANAIATGRLVVLVLDGGKVDGVALSASRLLIAGSLVLMANVITFGLLYWQLDGGGPAGRAGDPVPYPDFQFPQTSTAGLAAPGWRPRFPDHLYLAFTSAVAFSPTDTMPLTIRAKALMALQSLISLSVLVVVLARVINILPS
ncbi:hypothetical protein ACSMXN_22855 [Jatrophihabitans sp. DSM 45814]